MINPFLDPVRPVNGGLNRTRIVKLPGHDLSRNLLGKCYEPPGGALAEDATAAALVYAGGEDGVILTLGTS